MSEVGTASGPAITGIHHFSPTVSDVEASAAWYQRVFEMTRVPVPFPHHGDEEGGYAILLIEPRSGVVIGLHHHEANGGEAFHEARTGFDHIAFNVESRDDLVEWVDRLAELDVANSGVIDIGAPMPYSVVVFRDPDNIQLELFYMSAG
jgi:glyoxylase I family protein